MTPVFPKVKSIAVALLLPLVSFAGSKKDTTSVAAISKQLYESGNKNYIVADAVKDGFLYEGQPFSYEYDNGMLNINGDVLPSPYNKQYIAKMETFLEKEQGSTRAKFSMTGTKLNLDELAKENRNRKPTEDEGNAEAERNRLMEEVIDEMVADGLIKDKAHMTLKWNKGGIYVDGEKLDGASEKKYAFKMETALGYKPKLPSDGYRLSRNSSTE